MRIPARVVMAASPLALLLTLLLPAPAAHAQGLDVTGSWSIQMHTQFTDEGGAVVVGCIFDGTANVVQTGSQFTGDATVTLTSGGMTCPPTMSAGLSGDVTGNTVSMGMAMGGGAFGTGTFTGTVPPAPPKGGAGASMSGTFAVTDGPFAGTGGTWSALQLAPIAAVPALGPKGLAALALLLLAAALWLLLRRSALQRL
jgi:hypothetical protein